MLLNLSTQSPEQLEQALNEADPEKTTALSLGHAVALTDRAASNLRQLVAVESVDLSEVYLTPDQLTMILGLPKLRQISLYGGTSWEFDGSLNVMPTLGKAHFEALLAVKPIHLEVLELAYQDFEAKQIDELQAWMANVEIRVSP